MERECMRKKRESLEERRSPLQNLNGLPIHRRNTKNISPISSSSAPAASRSSLSVNNTSSSTPFSHSSKTHFHNKQNPLPKAAKFKPNVPTSRKPFLQTSRKDLDAKPTCKNRQRSKLSPVHGKSEKGSQEFQKKMKISDEEIDGDKACTVVGSVEHEDDGFRIGNELSPVILDYEPCLPAEGKGKSFSTGSNA
ncbi:uncharacterized protein LOC121807151 isoform X2 [Salvia splendens]|uniref:uncharacterized protein LOC121807151 isoform X2 n=1 Tax=Salvia splendens TaxID=180675 RepID=UPI001C263FAF|nr:uncharacterized protein LOC121807151 isoform X2 [Salvia splendens]